MQDEIGQSDASPNVTDDIDPGMLSLLVCPLTKQALYFERQNRELISEAAKLAYPVRGGIAIMLPSEARSLDDQG